MPTATIYASAGDGQVLCPASPASWSAARSASTGASVNYTGTQNYGPYVQRDLGDPWIARGYLPFDLSSIPSGSTISAIDLVIKPGAVYQYNSSGAVAVCSSTQASLTSLATSDYGNAGTTEYATRVNVSAFTGGTAKTIALNSSAISAATVGAGGQLLVCLRSSYDLDNSAPPSVSYEGLLLNYSERTGTSDDPYLVVTYTSGSAAVSSSDTWSWSDVASRTVPRTSSDTWSWSDAAVPTRRPVRSTADSWSWSDTTARPAPAARTAGTEYVVWAPNENGWAHYAFAVVTRTANGKLLAVCSRSTSHAAFVGSLVSKESYDDGATWVNERVIINGATTGYDERDPGILLLSSGRLVLTWGRRKLSGGYSIGTQPQFIYSDDHGVTWSSPVTVTTNLYAASPGDGYDGFVVGSDFVELESPSHLLMFGFGYIDQNATQRFQLFCSETTDGGATWSFVCNPATYSDAGGYSAVEPLVEKLETGEIFMTWHRESSPQKRYTSKAASPFTSWTHTMESTVAINRQGLSKMDSGRGLIVSGVNDSGQYWYVESRDRGATFNSRTQVNPTYDTGVTWPTWIMSVDLGGTGDTQNIGFIYSEEDTSQITGGVKYRQFAGLNGVFVYSRATTDAWAWSDSVTKSQTYAIQKTTSDTWSWTDSPARSRTSSRTPADTWAWTDSTTGVRGTGRTSADTWAWSETATRTVTHALTRTAADTWAWSDTVTGTLRSPTTVSRTTADTWAWTDHSNRSAPAAYQIALPATADFISARSQTADFISARSQTADFTAGPA